MGLSGWFDENGASGSGSMNGGNHGGLGMVPGQVGRGKMKGKGVFGYGSAEINEVDPVSHIPPAGAAQYSSVVSGAYPYVQNVIDWDKHTIRGTNTKLEKSYLRLTSVSSHLQ